MNHIIYVALGSAIGGTARFLLSTTMTSHQSGRFPLATFFINIIGSFAIGAFSGLLQHSNANVEAIRYFAIIGLCGGFTTFSTFSNESLQLIETGHVIVAATYVLCSICAGIGAAWCGLVVARG